MTEEIFDVVDSDDRVIGQAPRSLVHQRELLHRAVSIFVFDTQGRLLLQKRSARKDQFPGCYTSSASGHLAAGETYEEAAAREFEEELGLTTPLKFLRTFPAGPEVANEHTALFQAITDEKPTFDPQEIESGEYCEPDRVAERLRTAPRLFAPPFRVLFRWYWECFQTHGNGSA